MNFASLRLRPPALAGHPSLSHFPEKELFTPTDTLIDHEGV